MVRFGIAQETQAFCTDFDIVRKSSAFRGRISTVAFSAWHCLEAHECIRATGIVTEQDRATRTGQGQRKAGVMQTMVRDWTRTCVAEPIFAGQI